MADERGTIKHWDGGGSMITGKAGINYYRLLVVRQGLRAELRLPGLRMTRHVSALQAAKSLTGLKTHNRELQLARIDQMIEEAEKLIDHVKETTDE
jgi:hypothetical protein